MSLELGAVDGLDMFSPIRFTDLVVCNKLGLRPGFAVDLCERKQGGPNVGEFWDLNKPSDVLELKQMVNFEEPFLLTGSPPCDPFSQLLQISAHRRDPAPVKQQRGMGVQNLHTAIDFLWKPISQW